MKKTCLISIMILTVLIALTYLGLRSLFHVKRVSKSEMIENYEKYKSEINDAMIYYKSILPEESKCTIEFDENEIYRFSLYQNDTSYYSSTTNKNSTPIDSLLEKLNWTSLELNTLQTKLEKANTISIGGKERIEFGWFRTGPAMYSVEVHPENLSIKEIRMNNDSCRSIFYKDNIVFTYGGGAFGPYCFLKIEDHWHSLP